MIAEQAVADLLAPVLDDEAVVIDGAGLSDDAVTEIRKRSERSGDGPFARVAMEYVLLGVGEDDESADAERAWEALSPRYGINAADAVRDLYARLHGPLPDGPAPRVRFYSASRRPAEPGPLYRHAFWAEERDARYGPPPYDYRALREAALDGAG